MKKFYKWIIAVIVIGIGVLFGLRIAGETVDSVEGEIVDAVSSGAVWGAKIVIDGKSTFVFTSKFFEFRDILPGSYTLVAEAPNYQVFKKTIKVKRGKNVVNISMKGERIPDLTDILVFTQPIDKGIQIEIRLLDSQGLAIIHHPAFAFELVGSLYVREGVQGHYEKGMKIFEGPIDLFWDPKERLAKNKGIIPWGQLKFDSPSSQNSYGILEVVLKTPQGSFRYENDEVKLFKKLES